MAPEEGLGQLTAVFPKKNKAIRQQFKANLALPPLTSGILVLTRSLSLSHSLALFAGCSNHFG